MTKQQTKTRETNQTKIQETQRQARQGTKTSPQGNKNRQAQQGIQAKTGEF
jgi:hypothetical protein